MIGLRRVDLTLVLGGLFGLIAACGAPASRQSAVSVTTPSPGSSVGSVPTVRTAPSSDRGSHAIARRPSDVPLRGCDESAIANARAQIAAVDASLRRGAAPSSLPPVHDSLRAIWRSPCLLHFARLFPRPRTTLGFDELQAWWWGGAQAALAASVGGLARVNGERSLAIPPEVPAELTSEQRRALHPWICSKADRACDRAKSYVLRAEHAFERGAGSPRERSDRDDCTKGQSTSTDAPPPTFEEWARCVVRTSSEVMRYPSEGLRGPERGWLVLRGRRGHYRIGDEIRAYDLATGSAYVATSEGDLAFGSDGSVDFAATEANRTMRTYVGSVSVDQLRELAFVLVTAKAPRSLRVAGRTVAVPDEIPFSVTAPDDDEAMAFGVGTTGHPSWARSDQTQIGYFLVDGNVIQEGRFTWPNSANPVEDHADELLRVLEAGLVPDCPKAALPRVLGSPSAGGVAAIDADPARQRELYRALETALASLRTQNCRPIR